MSLPYPPLLTVQATAGLSPEMTIAAVKQDIAALQRYLFDLVTNIDIPADEGWVVSGTVADRTLASGDSLLATQNVLATLIQTLTERGLLSG